MTYSARYVRIKSIKMLRLHSDKLLGMTEVKKIADTKILIDNNDITLKNVVILMTCVIKDDVNIYQQIFLEKTLYVK